MAIADFATWRSKKLWTIWELAFLLKGLEPRERKDRGSQFQEFDPEMDEVESFCQYLFEIAARDPELDFGTSQRQDRFYPPSKFYQSKKLLLWASTIEGITIPEEIKPLLDESEGPQESMSTQKKLPAEDRPIGTRERETLLLIIAVMAKQLGLDLAKPFAAADPIVKMLADVGVERATNTVAEKLKEAHKLL